MFSKTVEVSFTMEVPVSRNVVFWNYWDQEHIAVVHKKHYSRLTILYEAPNLVVKQVRYKVPLIPGVYSSSMMIDEQIDESRCECLNIGFLGIPIHTSIYVEEPEPNHSVVKTTHRFELEGWRVVLAPFLKRMASRWNDEVWQEDLPLKLRRHRVLQSGFRDFQGIPENLENRVPRKDPLVLPIATVKTSPVRGWLSEVDMPSVAGSTSKDDATRLR